MTIRSFFSIALLFTLVCCKKHVVNPNNIITQFTITPRSALADGGTLITLVATIDSTADTDKRNVLFSASSGSFVGGKDSSISVPAQFKNSRLTATAYYTAPSSASTIYVAVQPDLNAYTNARITDSVIFASSVPAKVKLSQSSFAVRYGFLSEDTLIATLSNVSSGHVSSGNKVRFADFYLDGTSVGGDPNTRFRAVAAGVNANSQTSAIYSPGFTIAVMQQVQVRVIVLDSQGNDTNITDSKTITIIQ